MNETIPPGVPPPDVETPMNRLLAIDGGGIKAFVSIEILKKIESILAKRYAASYPGGAADFRLCHYFNFVGGTSAGSILAAMIATGKTMEEIERDFSGSAKDMFQHAELWRKPQWTYRRDRLAAKLQTLLKNERLGRPCILGDPEVQSLFMAVALNASTGSHWPINNNPEAKYNSVDSTLTNLCYPLWQVVRASTAAPTFFPPEILDTGKRHAEFVDGGVCSLNNPAFQMYLQATMPEYCLNMAEGTERLLIVSVGTGTSKVDCPDHAISEMHIVEAAQLAVQSLMESSSVLQDVFCRQRGLYANKKLPQEVDGEIGLVDKGEGKFTYLRYNPFLVENPNDPNSSPKHVDLDSLKEEPYLKKAGEAYAERAVGEDELPGGALFPNARGLPGLHVVRETTGPTRLRHFGGKRNEPDWLPEDELPDLKPIASHDQPVAPQRHRFVLSILVSLACTGTFGYATWRLSGASPGSEMGGVLQAFLETAMAGAYEFFLSSPPSAADLSAVPGATLPPPPPGTASLVGATLGLILSLGLFGTGFNVRAHEKRETSLRPLLLHLGGLAALLAAALLSWKALSSCEISKLIPVLWTLGAAVTLGSVLATIVLVRYRRWIAGVPLVSLIFVFFALAQMASLARFLGLAGLLMGIGLVCAFAGVHLLWFGRPARMVLKQWPRGKV